MPASPLEPAEIARSERKYRHVITGGAGFIGSHLTETLLARGEHVAIVDNLRHSQTEWLRRIRSHPRLQFHELDVRRSARLRWILAADDIVWHLAANTDMEIGAQATRVDVQHGLLATHGVLEAMLASGARQLLFASSGAVYGDIARPPAGEHYGPMLPVSLYGACKVAAEALINAYCTLFELQAWMFRFGNVLGARMSHGVIYDFIHKLQRDATELEILGDGTAEKNYILVEEVIDGMLFAWQHTTPCCEVFNLGTGSTTRVTDIANIVCQEMQLPHVRRRFTGGKRGWPGDQPQVFMDVTKMRRLGWSARHTSTEAVRIATRRYLGKADQQEITFEEAASRHA